MKLTVIFLTSILLPFAAHSEGTVSISVKLTPAGSFVAKTEKLKGDLVQSGGKWGAQKLSVSIDSFKTGMSLRDEHFCKHLGCEKFPKATLTDLKLAEGKGTGTLELNGVKKDLSFDYVEKAGFLETRIPLNSTDFGMPHAKYLGVEVSDLVTMDVRIALPKK